MSQKLINFEIGTLKRPCLHRLKKDFGSTLRSRKRIIFVFSAQNQPSDIEAISCIVCPTATLCKTRALPTAADLVSVHERHCRMHWQL